MIFMVGDAGIEPVVPSVIAREDEDLCEPPPERGMAERMLRNLRRVDAIRCSKAKSTSYRREYDMSTCLSRQMDAVIAQNSKYPKLMGVPRPDSFVVGCADELLPSRELAEAAPEGQAFRAANGRKHFKKVVGVRKAAWRGRRASVAGVEVESRRLFSGLRTLV